MWTFGWHYSLGTWCWHPRAPKGTCRGPCSTMKRPDSENRNAPLPSQTLAMPSGALTLPSKWPPCLEFLGFSPQLPPMWLTFSNSRLYVNENHKAQTSFSFWQTFVFWARCYLGFNPLGILCIKCKQTKTVISQCSGAKMKLTPLNHIWKTWWRPLALSMVPSHITHLNCSPMIQESTKVSACKRTEAQLNSEWPRMLRSNLAAKRSVPVQPWSRGTMHKNPDYIATGHRTINATLSERSQSRELDRHVA